MSPDRKKVLVHPSEMEMFGGVRRVWREWLVEEAIVVLDVMDTSYLRPNQDILLGGQTVQACLRNHLWRLADSPLIRSGAVHVAISRLASWGWDVFEGGGADERSLDEIVEEINIAKNVGFVISR